MAQPFPSAVAGFEVDDATVPAEVVESFADRRRSFQLSMVAGMTSVVEHHVLVEVRYTPHMPSHSLLNWFNKGKVTPLLPKSICSRGRRERCRKTGCWTPVLVMSRIILSNATALVNSAEW